MAGLTKYRKRRFPGLTVTQGSLRSPHCVALLDSGLSFLSGPTPLHHFVLATPASWNMLSAGLCLGP